MRVDWRFVTAAEAGARAAGRTADGGGAVPGRGTAEAAEAVVEGEAPLGRAEEGDGERPVEAEAGVPLEVESSLSIAPLVSRGSRGCD